MRMSPSLCLLFAFLSCLEVVGAMADEARDDDGELQLRYDERGVVGAVNNDPATFEGFDGQTIRHWKLAGLRVVVADGASSASWLPRKVETSATAESDNGCQWKALKAVKNLRTNAHSCGYNETTGHAMLDRRERCLVFVFSGHLYIFSSQTSSS